MINEKDSKKLKFIKAKKSFEMECPYCGGPSFPIRTSKDK